ncbi:MAG TPA: ribonucleoside triphosphate reductase [Firmicutes bacterium]|nr:MAG: ribonucleoside-triphosphate reductase [Peptococcaceae bacterium 1109]HHT73788.1 ribonucleoside triphosphate reductase [Bacillota bacterium]
MESLIKKRDGRIVPFDEGRIANAIYKASKAVGRPDVDRAAELAELVTAQIDWCEMPTVEGIQDLVEQVLISQNEAAVAKAYILYRQQRHRFRDFTSTIVDAQKMISEYLGRADWRVNENSNMNYSLQGLNNHIISAVSSKYWLEEVYPEEIRDAHMQGDFHIHDLGLLAPYCCGWNLEDLLLKGFAGVSEKVESTPARHFRTALGQVANFFYTLQGEAAGAQAFANFDTYLAPFIRHDGLDYPQVKQALQEFVFNLNVPTRVGFQTPFVNITMDLTPSGQLAHSPVIIGGEYQDACYGDYQKEMDMLNMAFCEVMMEGDAKGRTFSFPIPTYNITADLNWNSPVFNKVLAMTAKYGIPYFTNFLNSDLSPDDVRSMCCRLRLDARELRKRGGGLFGANPLTGSIGVVTINLPRIGYLSQDKGEFFQRLEALMELAKESLILKRLVLEDLMHKGLFPYSRAYLDGVYQRFGRYWDNHFNTIGLVGMNEALINFMGCDLTSHHGQGFAREVLEFMRARLVEFQEETGQLFNLEATPAEGTSYRLAKLDKEAYPLIKTAGDGKGAYYTNSTQLPVDYTSDLFAALDLQNDLQVMYTGGTVFHAFLGEQVDDIDAVRETIRTVFTQYEIPYFTLTPTFSICAEHGYIRGEQPACPHCGKATEVWSRVVGFYRPVKNWNLGKQCEFGERQTFQVAQGA